jgi:hypothetical protein
MAHAYAEGWVGLDRVLSWAEERELEDEEVIMLLERCASEGHSLEPSLTNEPRLTTGTKMNGEIGS